MRSGIAGCSYSFLCGYSFVMRCGFLVEDFNKEIIDETVSLE